MSSGSHAGNREEIAKWRRGEPSGVVTLEELLAGLDARDDADEDC